MRDQFFIEEPKHITYRPQNDLPASAIELNGQIIGGEAKSSAPAEDTRQASIQQDSLWSNATKPTATPRGAQMPQERVAQALRDIEELGHDQSQHDFSGNIVDPPAQGQRQSANQWPARASDTPSKSPFSKVFWVIVVAAILLPILAPALTGTVSDFDGEGEDYGSEYFYDSEIDEFVYEVDPYFIGTDSLVADDVSPERINAFDEAFMGAVATELDMRNSVDFPFSWDTQTLEQVVAQEEFTHYNTNLLVNISQDNGDPYLSEDAMAFALATGLLDLEVDHEYVKDFIHAFTSEDEGLEIAVNDEMTNADYQELLEVILTERGYL